MSKVGFIASAFDLLHPGHLVLLEECKKHCDHLIVALHTNPQLDRPNKNKPIETVFERWVRIRGCRYVDEVIPYETEADLLNMLKILKPEVRFLGSDYKDRSFTGDELEISVIYFDRSHDFSSSALRSRLLKV